MDASWWQVPGPSRFLDGVVDDLRNGKNVVLPFPAYPTLAFADSFRERVRDLDRWRWRTADASKLPAESVSSLTEALSQKFAASETGHEPRSITRLAKSLDGIVIWVENMNGSIWRTWSDFLAQYQHACHELPEWNRGLFCVPTCGMDSTRQLSDVALSVRRWEGIVRRLDMLLFLDRILPIARRFPLHRQVTLAVATELAGADVELGRRLVQLDLAKLLAPNELLLALATDRGWNKSAVKAPSWASGTSDVIDGSHIVHSAAAAMKGDLDEIQHRIWRGQVTVLFAFVEEMRRRILPRVRSYLRLPVETTYGIVSDADDLEVGQLLYFLRGMRLPNKLWGQLKLLTDIRHSLAHLQPVSHETLCSEDLFSNMES